MLVACRENSLFGAIDRPRQASDYLIYRRISSSDHRYTVLVQSEASRRPFGAIEIHHHRFVRKQNLIEASSEGKCSPAVLHNCSVASLQAQYVNHRYKGMRKLVASGSL
jgi:hypothetical protein